MARHLRLVAMPGGGAVKGINEVQLRYQVSWPLNVVLDGHIMAGYEKVRMECGASTT